MGDEALTPDSARQIKVIDQNGAAIPIDQAYAGGIRFESSDETLATVSASGLVTALKPGQVTVSVIRFDADLQAIGQDDITLTVSPAQLTDSDDATPAPRSVVIDAVHGGAVSSATGETVLIGPGALPADTPVAIRRIELANVEAETGLAIPLPQALQAVGAFRLELGGARSLASLQLALPLQDNPAFEPGEEVIFLRKGRMLTERNIGSS
jgi:hypothetical protein